MNNNMLPSKYCHNYYTVGTATRFLPKLKNSDQPCKGQKGNWHTTPSTRSWHITGCVHTYQLRGMHSIA